jgi:prophage regulatory protein
MKLLRQKEVIERLGMARSPFLRMVDRGEFPKPVKIGPKLNHWPEHEVDAWIQSRADARNAKTGA